MTNNNTLDQATEEVSTVSQYDTLLLQVEKVIGMIGLVALLVYVAIGASNFDVWGRVFTWYIIMNTSWIMVLNKRNEIRRSRHQVDDSVIVHMVVYFVAMAASLLIFVLTRPDRLFWMFLVVIGSFTFGLAVVQDAESTRKTGQADTKLNLICLSSLATILGGVIGTILPGLPF